MKLLSNKVARFVQLSLTFDLKCWQKNELLQFRPSRTVMLIKTVTRTLRALKESLMKIKKLWGFEMIQCTGKHVKEG